MSNVIKVDFKGKRVFKVKESKNKNVLLVAFQTEEYVYSAVTPAQSAYTLSDELFESGMYQREVLVWTKGLGGCMTGESAKRLVGKYPLKLNTTKNDLFSFLLDITNKKSEFANIDQILIVKNKRFFVIDNDEHATETLFNFMQERKELNQFSRGVLRTIIAKTKHAFSIEGIREFFDI